MCHRVLLAPLLLLCACATQPAPTLQVILTETVDPGGFKLDVPSVYQEGDHLRVTGIICRKGVSVRMLPRKLSIRLLDEQKMVLRQRDVLIAGRPVRLGVRCLPYTATLPSHPDGIRIQVRPVNPPSISELSGPKAARTHPKLASFARSLRHS